MAEQIYEIVGKVVLSSPFWAVVLWLVKKWFNKVHDVLALQNKSLGRIESALLAHPLPDMHKQLEKMKVVQQRHEERIAGLYSLQQPKHLRPS